MDEHKEFADSRLNLAAPFAMRSPLLLLTALIATSAGLRGDDSPGIEFFEKRIRPVLVEHCYECHSAESKKVKGKLRLDSREAILRGGETGPALIKGQPMESLLITAVQYHDKDLAMPPPEDDVPRKLADAVIADLVEWVKMGAPMPSGADRPASNPSSTALAHWAFQAPKEQTIPRIKDEAWAKTTVDRFILAKHEAAGLKPAPLADRRTLIRRATFDLTGLPPTVDEVASFITDASPDAFVKVIERLLASPHYGERWGRHWLDVARYADTKGYVYAREERFFVHAWAYRDWVVKAFNDDLPYDRFLLLQIAADQLVPDGSPDLAAMGFITGGRRFIGVTRDIIDDRIDVVTRGTMALTAACARCHDHKYDPIPTRDYYSLHGVFASCEERLVSLGAESTDAEFAKRSKKLADTMKQRRDEAATRLRARVCDYLAAQSELQKYPEEGFDQILATDDLIPASVRRWRDFLHRTKSILDPIFAPWQALAKLPPESFETQAPAALEHLLSEQGAKLNPVIVSAFTTAPKTQREAADRYGKLFAEASDAALIRFLNDPRAPTSVPDTGIINNELFFPTNACEELWKLQGEVDRWLIQTPTSTPHALILTDRAPERNPRVFIRGNPARQGGEVPRQFLQVVAGPARAPFQNGSGRLELARAIVDPENPLTARVMVNRVWQHHFGAGLVRTSSDFGVRAEAPSHPELLDWLAREFVRSGWSVKALHRLIMSGAVYRQVSAAVPSSDVENRLLSSFPRQRLDFEQMRDAMLLASGELETTIGGKPAELLTSANKRRTLYGLVDRQFLPGTFRVFDFANPDIHIAQRHATTVPQQALFFLNHTFVANRARAIAARAEIADAPSDRERVQRLTRALFQRAATEHEVATALRFIAAAEVEATAPAPPPPETAWSYGWGEYDDAAKRVKSFTPFPHFTGKAWQGAESFPNAVLGWAQLTAEGGHPGDDRQHACTRRWTAPEDAVISISGELVHEPEAGDGIRAFVVSSRHGELQAMTVHHSREPMSATSIEVKQGDTLDFIVDIRDGLNSDQFLWSPTITAADTKWNAKEEFSGPLPQTAQPLKPWEQYAHVLLLSNEFSFVD